eukprot:435981-Prymnesium_polylepis.1
MQDAAVAASKIAARRACDELLQRDALRARIEPWLVLVEAASNAKLAVLQTPRIKNWKELSSPKARRIR